MSVSLNCFYRQYLYSTAFDNSSLYDNGDAEISGRLCLRNVWITTAVNSSNPIWATIKIARGTTYNASNVALELPYVCNAVADIYPNLEIPGGGMLFEDGLSFQFTEPFDSSDTDLSGINLIQTVTLLYSGGNTSISLEAPS
jgi:hypothetical protein